MYSELYGFGRKHLLPGAKMIRQSLRELESTEWLSREELKAIQLKKIQNLVAYAYEHVPFYRKRYQQKGIHPQDIRSFKDFRALPFLTKDDVNNNIDELTCSEYQGEIFEDMTGGSTGKPMRFIMDRSTALWSAAVETRYRGWYGIKMGDRRAWIWGNLKDFPNWKLTEQLAAYVKRYRFLNTRSLTKESMASFAEMLEKWKPAMFRVYPSALEIFSQYIKEQRKDICIRPKLIETSAEKLTDYQRELINEVFAAPIAEHYSSWEIYDIAYHCPSGGYHVSEDRYLELVDRSGNTVMDGNIGEVVITSLNQYAMPFIRYKNDDLATYEINSCVCGRSMPILQEVVGRTTDVLVAPDGHPVHWSGFYSIIRRRKEIYQAQIYQPDKEHVEVRIVGKSDIDSTILQEIKDQLQPCFGNRMNISMNLVDHVTLTSSGKQRFTISDVQPDIF